MKQKKGKKGQWTFSMLIAAALAFASLLPTGVAFGAQWHGDIREFHRRDLHVWRGGRWVHGWHARRFAWWWVAGGLWYFYPAPVYPYPDPYTPPVVAPPPQPQPQYWYYCRNPAGYYPYVPECPGGWQAVPATPPPSPPPSLPPPPPRP